RIMQPVYSIEPSEFAEAHDMPVPGTSTRLPASTTPPQNGPIPPLENGDRLTRAEFERRYEAMPNLKRGELMEGVVYVPSPVRHTYHVAQHSLLNFWLCAYEGGTPGVAASDNSTVRLDAENEPQPDCLLIVRPDCGGPVRIDEDGYIEGTP